MVDSEDEAFLTGHKTVPVNFMPDNRNLKTLRNLQVLRKRKSVHGADPHGSPITCPPPSTGLAAAELKQTTISEEKHR